MGSANGAVRHGTGEVASVRLGLTPNGPTVHRGLQAKPYPHRPFPPSMTALVVPTISVVVPVHRGGDAFRACAAALARALGPGDEWMVVADGETDGAWRDLPDTEAVVRTVVREVAAGPAVARNVGARVATGDVLFFVDADVVVGPDTVERVRRRFAADPGLTALVGSYDAAPADPAFLSQFRNLLHHHVHQTAGPAFSTFWTGCGAVRRDAFLRLGGFDEGYTVPCIEDIEFGYRLGDAGYRIALDKGLQVTHLKSWSAADMVRTDILRRAAPWTELLLRRGAVEDNLNVDTRGRLSVVAVAALAASACAVPLAPRAGLASAGVAVGALVALNAPFYRYLRQVRGFGFAARAVPWHAVHYACAAAGLGIGTARHLRRRRPALGPPHPYE